MITPTYQLLMPAVLAGGAGLIGSRNPERYPALLAWSFLTAFYVGCVWGDAPYPLWVYIAAAVVLPFQVRESLIRRRIPVSWRQFFLFVAAALSLSVSLSDGYLWVGRSYYQLIAMGVMCWATIHRMRHPMVENRRDVAYGVGMTIWLTVKAPASTFVLGGLGMRLFPQIPRDSVEQWCYWALIVCFTGMALAMWAKSPGAKRAAVWARKQKVVTGKLERVAA